MDLEKLQEMADKDLVINETELDLESLKTPQLHNKYMKHYTKFKLMLTKAETDYRQLKRYKWEYYTGKSDAQVYAEKPFDLKILSDKYQIELLQLRMLSTGEDLLVVLFNVFRKNISY